MAGGGSDPGSLYLGLSRDTCGECGKNVEARYVTKDGHVYLERHCPEHGALKVLVAESLASFLDARRRELREAGMSTPLTATRGLCNDCGEIVDARIVLDDQRVLIEKCCPEHGLSRGLVSSDRDWYLRSLSYLKPGTEPKARAALTHEGCPTSCGLCPEHRQHTCVPILEITGRCDMACPICLVADTEQPELSLAGVRKVLDDLVRYEGRLNMLTLSGGEPMRHPEFPEILDACRRPEIGLVSVSTNGSALMASDDLIRALRDRDVVVSLQFDGFRPATYEAHRGDAGLAERKVRLIDRILELGGRLSLTATVARGVNEDELPAILDLLLERDGILSLMVQPLAGTNGDPLDRTTIPDVVRILAEGSSGLLQESDFSPLPCSHPTCFALTYLLKLEDGGTVPLPRILDADSYLDVIKNQALLGTDRDSIARVRDALYALWSSDGLVPNRDAVLGKLKQVLEELNRLGAGAPHRDVIELGTRNVKSIFIHHFMDRTNFDLSRVVQCCNHVPQLDGRLIPSCVRNNCQGWL